MNDEQVEALAVKHESFGFGQVDAKGLTIHGFDPDGLAAFVTALLASRDAEIESMRQQLTEKEPQRQELMRAFERQGNSAQEVITELRQQLAEREKQVVLMREALEKYRGQLNQFEQHTAAEALDATEPKP